MCIVCLRLFFNTLQVTSKKKAELALICWFILGCHAILPLHECLPKSTHGIGDDLDHVVGWLRRVRVLNMVETTKD